MATTKLSATKSTSRAINYAEKRAVEKSGLNCDVDYAKSSFKAARELYGKTDGNQGHVIIQSFQPCLLYTSPSPRDVEESRMPSSA